MRPQIDTFERRTSADVVFDYLRGEIVSNTLRPGTKISEVDIANRFGVSRQPVRDAFSRLANQDLLLIRPQKPTEVKKFSSIRISQARFIRLSVELEVVRRACDVWDEARAGKVETNLLRQRRAVEEKDAEGFHDLDYGFHKLICDLSGNSEVFETIQFFKGKVDRLCLLSLEQTSETSELLQDHWELADALLARRARDAEQIVRLHLSRLDGTIRAIQEEQAEFFED